MLFDEHAIDSIAEFKTAPVLERENDFPQALAEDSENHDESTGAINVDDTDIFTSVQNQSPIKNPTTTRRVDSVATAVASLDVDSALLDSSKDHDLGILARGRAMNWIPAGEDHGSANAQYGRELNLCAGQCAQRYVVTNTPVSIQQQVDDCEKGLSGCPGMIQCWDTSQVDNMRRAFYRQEFNGNLDCWDTSQVTDMREMFSWNEYWDYNIEFWDTSKVTSMFGMFQGATSFNQPLNGWDTSNVYDFGGMFQVASAFNQPLYDWDVAKATSMANMFENAETFNQPLDDWDPSGASFMNRMFLYAKEFNQCLSTWADKTLPDVIINEPTKDMFYDTKCPLQVTDANVGPWCSNACPLSDGLQDCSACAQRPAVTDIPTSIQQQVDDCLTGQSSCPGDISCWDTSRVTNMTDAFSEQDWNGALNCWDTSSVMDMRRLFAYNPSFNGIIEDWDTSSLEHAGGIFAGAAAFNQPLNGWNTSKVGTMANMFLFAASFNQPLDQWDVSKVRVMYGMFERSGFNQPIDNWNPSQVVFMGLMFAYANDFNQCLPSWADKTPSTVDITATMGGADMFFDSGCPDQDTDANVGPWCQSVCNTYSPSSSPSEQFALSDAPSDAPTYAPSVLPSDTPSTSPTGAPSYAPSVLPSDTPSASPTGAPSTSPSFAPSSMPSLSCTRKVRTHPFCSNDPTFISNGKANRDCDWFAKNPFNRCITDERAAVFCPEVCNPRCIRCDDNPDYLHLDKPKRNCEWVAKKPDIRCSLPPNEEPLCECPEVCNPICKNKCKNNNFYRQRGIPKRDCDWIASNPKKLRKRCNMFKHDAWFGCPGVCDKACA